MDWDSVDNLLNDGNQQNPNAANAGDGPKHIAWLTFIEIMGPHLKTVVETHSGGGIYRVPPNSFCVGLGSSSILGRSQFAAEIPATDQREVYFSASGDQALRHMPDGCRYIAFDKCVGAANRLKEVAHGRERSRDLDSRAVSYAGNGDPATSLRRLLQNVDSPVLAMVDPWTLPDLRNASDDIRSARHVRSILFGVTSVHFGHGRELSEQGWGEIARAFSEARLNCITWKWKGKAVPTEESRHLFFLLLSTPNLQESDVLLEGLIAEHKILVNLRAGEYGYASDGPQAIRV
jgi:hypothetical protein